jgi:hypothetical protein
MFVALGEVVGGGVLLGADVLVAVGGTTVLVALGVAVELSVLVGVNVAVADRGVLVLGDTGVLLGSTGVIVGGTTVLVAVDAGTPTLKVTSCWLSCHTPSIVW